MASKPTFILHNGIDTIIRGGGAPAADAIDIMRALFSWFQDQCVAGKRLGDVGEAAASESMVYLPPPCVGCDGTCVVVETFNPLRPCEHLPEPGAVVFYNGVYRVDSVMRSVVIATSPELVRSLIGDDVAELGFEIDVKRIVAEPMTTRDFPAILDRMCVELGADHAEVLAHLRQTGCCYLRSVTTHTAQDGDDVVTLNVDTATNLLVGTLAEPSEYRHQLCKEEAEARHLAKFCRKSWDCIVFDDEGEPGWPRSADCASCEFSAEASTEAPPDAAEISKETPSAAAEASTEAADAGTAVVESDDVSEAEMAEAMAWHDKLPETPVVAPKRSHKAKPKV